MQVVVVVCAEVVAGGLVHCTIGFVSTWCGRFQLGRMLLICFETVDRHFCGLDGFGVRLSFASSLGYADSGTL